MVGMKGDGRNGGSMVGLKGGREDGTEGRKYGRGRGGREEVW